MDAQKYIEERFEIFMKTTHPNQTLPRNQFLVMRMTFIAGMMESQNYLIKMSNENPSEREYIQGLEDLEKSMTDKYHSTLKDFDENEQSIQN